MESENNDATTRVLRMEALLVDLGRVITEAEQRACGSEFVSTSHVVGEVCGAPQLDGVAGPLAAAAAARRVTKLHDLLQRRPGRGQLRRLHHIEHINRVVYELAQSIILWSAAEVAAPASASREADESASCCVASCDAPHAASALVDAVVCPVGA